MQLWEFSIIDFSVDLLIFLSMGQWTQRFPQPEQHLTVHGHAVVEADTSPGFYSRSGRVGEVERNERESGCWSSAHFFKTKVDLLPVALSFILKLLLTALFPLLNGTLWWDRSLKLASSLFFVWWFLFLCLFDRTLPNSKKIILLVESQPGFIKFRVLPTACFGITLRFMLCHVLN